MASNNNNQQKGSGADNSEINRSAASDASDVDWMIMSDLGTKIGGFTEPPKTTIQPVAKSPSPSLARTNLDDDLEDMEWLQSIGLDAEIERSPTGTSTETRSNVENIDWLIVSDLKQRLDDTEGESRAKVTPPNVPQPMTLLQSSLNSLDDSLIDDLGLAELNFSEDGDFLDLEDLGFDTSDGLDDLNSISLDSIGDDSEQNFLDFNSFLEDNFDLNDELNDLAPNPSDDWQSIAKIEDSISEDLSKQLEELTSGSEQVGQFYEDPENLLESPFEDQFIDQVDQFTDYAGFQSPSQSGLEIFNHSFEMETQISVIAGIGDEYESEFEPEFAEAIAAEPTALVSEDQDFQDVFDNEINNEISNETFLPSANDLDSFEQSFAEVQDDNSLDAAIGDEIWSSSAAISPDSQSYEDAFADNWEAVQNIGEASDESIWGGTEPEAGFISAPSIDNAFEDAWQPAESSESSVPLADDWSAELEAEVDEISPDISTIDPDWNGPNEDSFEQDFNQSSDWSVESAPALEAVDANELIDWQESIEAESAADYYADELVDSSYAPEWEEVAESLHPLDAFAENIPIPSLETDDFVNENFDFHNNLQDELPDNLPDDFDAINLEIEDAESWAIAEASFAESDLVDDFIPEQISAEIPDEFNDNYNSNYESLAEPMVTDLGTPQSAPILLDDFDDFGDHLDDDFDQEFAAAIADQITDSSFRNNFAMVPPPETIAIPQPDIIPNVLPNQIESILGENFDLATFESDSLIDDFPLRQLSVPTTLTPSRPQPENIPNYQPDSIPAIPTGGKFEFEDEFERAIAEDEFEAALGIEESLANELLNGGGLSTDFPPDVNMAIPSPNFDSTDHDFLDDFDLDSIGTDFDSDEFGSNFANPVVSTSLTPPSPPAQPSSSPPPPPFMLPLPPMRGNTQPKQPPSNPSLPLTPPQQVSGSSGNIDDRNFDSFHNDELDSSKFRKNKSIGSIDQSWSDLLDADTVLSDVLTSPTTRGVNPSQSNMSHRPMTTPDYAAQDRLRGGSSPSSGRKQPKLPDFEELGLEIHNDDNDWSGLLESGDLSDNITVVSSASMPTSSRTQPPIARRSDSTMSTGETRAIPRDRRQPMQNFGDANQARMSAPPDQIDFNRFTDDRFEPTEPSAAMPPKPQASMPSVSIESLWQNYLKFPALGLGAIGIAVLLYTVMNRPVFELGLRWGIFKDARGLDFTNADFRGAKLDNVDFTKAILSKAKMQDASIEGANFQDANLDGVNFAKAKLNQAKMVGASVIWSDFKDAQMRFVDLAGANLTRSNFRGANLNGASFKGTKIGAPATAEATKLPAIYFLAWQIVNQPLEGRNLSNKNLSYLNLSFSNLKRANLSGTKLNFTDLAEADLRGANLTGGQIDGANLNGAKLNGSNLTGVKFDKSKLPKTDEQTVCPNGKNGPCKF
ncbi:MAG: hypothetical protein AUK48_11035 [Oscillatoriales cyanobacterium CG2_30_44_21]|nr:MAG: hypothetical protein AUK48_11035 [Oscillatoriales cyanobacterium CG2_30_44_21]